MTTTIIRPPLEDYPVFYKDYIKLLPEGDVLYLLERQAVDLRHMFKKISDTRAEETYAEGK
ncbi:hypothetical protein ACFSKU_08370 [Pontibacter silvestris]|uniref:Uncharacterized protein n=1 Tax=Pontibacter silvestris TaxID=2305183 RepID=A0ABW4WYF6_9BACT|nr:hypothetical protein [Pontibacter silvestris]MCC9137391.1 hypothetical protein [Pontibacter silvestris]